MAASLADLAQITLMAPDMPAHMQAMFAHEYPDEIAARSVLGAQAWETLWASKPSAQLATTLVGRHDATSDAVCAALTAENRATVLLAALRCHGDSDELRTLLVSNAKLPTKVAAALAADPHTTPDELDAIFDRLEGTPALWALAASSAEHCGPAEMLRRLNGVAGLKTNHRNGREATKAARAVLALHPELLDAAIATNSVLRVAAAGSLRTTGLERQRDLVARMRDADEHMALLALAWNPVAVPEVLDEIAGLDPKVGEAVSHRKRTPESYPHSADLKTMSAETAAWALRRCQSFEGRDGNFRPARPYDALVLLECPALDGALASRVLDVVEILECACDRDPVLRAVAARLRELSYVEVANLIDPVEGPSTRKAYSTAPPEIAEPVGMDLLAKTAAKELWMSRGASIEGLQATIVRTLGDRVEAWQAALSLARSWSSDVAAWLRAAEMVGAPAA